MVWSQFLDLRLEILSLLAINKVFQDLKLDCDCFEKNSTSNFINYKCTIGSGSKLSEIKSNIDNISFACKSTFFLSIDNNKGNFTLSSKIGSSPINLIEFIRKINFQPSKFECLIGESIDGKEVILDIESSPHILIAGTTGSGKSTMLHSIIANIIFYDQADIFLVDPKRIEFSKYSNVETVKYYTSYESTISCLKYLNNLMEYRYKNYNSNNRKIVLVIDEISDLFTFDENKEMYKLLLKLAQKSRAVGIHCIIATQRPSAKIIDGNIKANFPCRISCRVASKVDSRIVLDSSGAEALFGKGDAIMNNGMINRFQCTYITPEIVINSI